MTMLDRYERDRRDSLLEDRFPWGQTLTGNYYSSRAIHKVIQLACERTRCEVLTDADPQVGVVAIGSIGRLDGLAGFSDIDLVLLIDRDISDDESDDLRSRFFTHLVKHNTGLIFDHRDVIEAGQFTSIPTRNISYPVVSLPEIETKTDDSALTQRRIQFLFESTSVLNEDLWVKACSGALKKYGMEVELPVLYPSDSFLRDFEAFSDGMWKRIVDREQKSSNPNNQKIAKAFYLRRNNSRIDCLAIAMSAFMRSSIQGTEEILQYTTAPPYIKLGFWIGDRFGRWFGKQLSSEVSVVACEAIRSIDGLADDASVKAAEGDLEGAIRGAVIATLRDLDRLLELLYSQDMMDQIKSVGSDYLTWRTNDVLGQLERKGEAVNRSAKSLASVVDAVFTTASEASAMAYDYPNSRLQKWVDWAATWDPGEAGA